MLVLIYCHFVFVKSTIKLIFYECYLKNRVTQKQWLVEVRIVLLLGSSKFRKADVNKTGSKVKSPACVMHEILQTRSIAEVSAMDLIH